MVPLLLALVLAPDPPAVQTYDLKLRFEKGMVYEEASTRRVKLRLIQQKNVLRFDVEEQMLVRRTVLDVGPDNLPSEEKVEIVRFSKDIHERPDGDPTKEKSPDEGKTFTWRKVGEGYALFDGDKDVTADHESLVERLKSWRAKRLPDKAVAVGATWEVPAAEFLEATGQQVPPGLQGTAIFRLEEVKDGVARISTEVKSGFTQQGRGVTGVQKGTWTIDLAKGRDLTLEAEGTIEFDRLKSGDGSLHMTRVLTYR
jgi:hypothetical protein